jgi:hypothetical protein
MPVLTWINNHRLWSVGVVLIVLTVGAAAFWFFVVRSPGTPVGVQQAIRLYRQSQRARSIGRPAALSPPGVYRYETTGGESLSIGGISRSFPATTDLIVTDGRCATMRWEPLEQHIENVIECPLSHGGFVVTSFLSYEDIAGTKTTDRIECPMNTYFVPPHPMAQERWHAECHSTGQRVAMTGRVMGSTQIDVGNRSVTAIHTRITLAFSGSETGTNPNDYWLDPADGLILRQHETVAISQKAGPLGSVRYHEQMTIAIASEVPVR